MKKTQGKPDTLEGVLNEIWTMLKRGVTSSYDPFHWPVLGTTGKNGSGSKGLSTFLPVMSRALPSRSITDP